MNKFIGKYYRFTYDGIGIYEAYHQACMKLKRFDLWKDFLNDAKKTKWLPNPDNDIKEYRSSYRSFFTQKGYDYFTRLVLPTFLQLLDKKNILLQEFSDVPLKYKLIYSDDFQVVVDLNQAISSIKEWNNFSSTNNNDELNSFLESLSSHNSYVKSVLSEATGINFITPPKRIAKHLSPEDTKYILSINHTRACEKSLIMDLFADFGDGPKYDPYDIIEVPKGSYGGLSYSKNPEDKEDAQSSSKKTNSVKFTTTAGLWVFNRAFIEPMSDILGYINTPITDDVYGSINSKISNALLEDKITVRQLKNFIIQGQIMMSCCSALASSHTETMFTMEEKIAKKKAELLASPKYKDMKKNADLVLMKDFEKEMIDYAKEILRDDPAIDMFNSGARSSWGNNFRNMYIMRSGLKHTDGSYTISTTSYIEGMNPEEYPAINDASIGGPFDRARKTAGGGYLERLVLGSTAHLRILPKNSDCGSTKYLSVLLTNKNVKDWMFSYIQGSKGLEEITPETKDKYIGKTVKIRFSSLCKKPNGCICEACAGSLFRRVGITNAGIASPIMMSSLKNASMKSFHSNSTDLSIVDPTNVFSLND